MAKVTKIESKKPIPQLKRVAAYARVSRDTERLMHSVSTQISYYSQLIQRTPGWKYVGVYADCGISGMNTKNRTEFKRLIEDCEQGKIDIIITKSISRFSRNTIDFLTTVRRLKELGVEVRFEKENINSMSGDGELMLSLLASFAQEESRSISENCKWGIRKRFKSGEIGAANKHILGYRFDDERNQYIIIPEEVECVKEMFKLFLDGVPYRKIAEELNNKGFRTINGKLFEEGSVCNLLHNEIYAGDLIRQKKYIADPIGKIKVKNKGELSKYYLVGSHEAIIDRETYEKVKTELERRHTMLNDTYPFTGKIKCGLCGYPFTRKCSVVKGRRYVHWICRAKKEVGMTCTSVNFREDRLKEICAEVLGLAEFNEDEFSKSIEKIVVLDNGSLEFYFYGGEKRIWQKGM